MSWPASAFSPFSERISRTISWAKCTRWANHDSCIGEKRTWCGHLTGMWECSTGYRWCQYVVSRCLKNISNLWEVWVSGVILKIYMEITCGQMEQLIGMIPISWSACWEHAAFFPVHSDRCSRYSQFAQDRSGASNSKPYIVPQIQRNAKP